MYGNEQTRYVSSDTAWAFIAAARLRVRKELAESAGVVAVDHHHQRERNASGSGKPPLIR